MGRAHHARGPVGKKNSFITLTYDDAHLGNNPSLDVRDWKLFAKRSRQHLSRQNEKHGTDETFRFFHCGEYGEKHRRKHLHAAVFGQNYSEDRTFLKTTQHGHKLYTSALLSSLWPHGLHSIGELTFESAAYVARYVMKKRNGASAEEHYETMDPETGEVINLKPEYSTMSRNPGLGEKWIIRYMDEVYPSDEIIINGHKTRPPKYYDEVYKREHAKEFDQVRRNRIKNAKPFAENNTAERLKIREEVKIARTRYLTRDL